MKDEIVTVSYTNKTTNITRFDIHGDTRYEIEELVIVVVNPNDNNNYYYKNYNHGQRRPTYSWNTHITLRFSLSHATQTPETPANRRPENPPPASPSPASLRRIHPALSFRR